MTHDYERHGTTTLFAALNLLECKRHWPTYAAPPSPGVHPLPNAIEAQAARKIVHAILDNYAAHRTYLNGSPTTRPSFSLHTDDVLVAHCSRRILHQICQAAAQARRVPGRVDLHQP